MKSLKSICVALCAALVLVGCNMNNTVKGTAIGAGGGAALGAIVGAIAGNAGIGAAIGTAVGAGAGAIIGHKMDKAKKEAEAIQNAQVEEVKDANGLDAVKVSLQELAGVLKNNSDCDVAIQGYTDNQGFKNSTAEQSAQKNKALSLDRAAAVSSYLQSLSVPASQIKSVDGFGQDNPVADNSTAAGREQNRRVEVYMYASQKMINEANAQAGK